MYQEQQSAGGEPENNPNPYGQDQNYRNTYGQDQNNQDSYGQNQNYQAPYNQNTNYQQYSYNNGNYQMPYNQMPYNQAPQMDLEEPMKVSEWLISFLIMLVPCVNIVMAFVWAFGQSEKKSKSNFFKAYLIFIGIFLALYLVLIIVIAALGFATLAG